jgi:hypothetical protein
MPEVSVLLPVYNGRAHLREAVDSVLAQTFRDFELVIVDDGSTDASREVVESYADARIRLLAHDRNRGLPAALNTGLAAARGALVARQDQDDWSDPRRLERQVAWMRAHPDVALLGTRAHAIDGAGRATGAVNRPLSALAIRWYALLDNPFIHTSVMFRRAVVWEELGGYDTSLGHCEDYELWTRVLARHQAGNLPDRLVAYRVRPDSMMASVEGADEQDPYRVEYVRVLRLVVARESARVLAGLEIAGSAERLAQYVLGVPAGELDAFLDAWQRLRDAFERQYPGARRCAAFHRTLAGQLDAIAVRVRPPSRRAALRVYARGLRRDPFLARWLPWPRALALAVLGPGSRRGFARARRRAPFRPVVTEERAAAGKASRAARVSRVR